MRALLLLLLWGGALASDLAHAATEHCHRAHSRQAGRIIERAISPLVRAKQYTLPEGCPLDASLSVFTRQEQHKRVVRKGVWQCDFDRKVFRSEAFIDQHMENRHADERLANATACLGDLCDALQCSFFEAFAADSHAALAHVPCSPAAMDRTKLQCQDLAHSCFPLHGGAAAQELHAHFAGTFCAASQCSWRERERLLKPLVEDRHSIFVLWMLLVWAVVVVLALGYALLLCHWSSRVPSRANSVLHALGASKWKADKMY